MYVSNKSDVQAVYFDNLAVVHTRSKLLEEATYYPFGLKIAALSAQAFQKPTAPDKFQGDYSDYEEETGWNDFELRSYDPQIGRWLQVDPYDEFTSPYVGMGNDWVNKVDPNGGTAWDPLARLPAPQFANVPFLSLSSSSSGSVASTGGGGGFLAGLLSTLGNIAVQTAMQLQSSGGGRSLSGSTGSGQRPSTPSQPILQSGGGCNCPPGYGPTPKHTGDQPLYLDPDDVALDWSYVLRPYGIHGNLEFSSLIYAIDVSSGVGTAKTTLYGATRAVRNPPSTDPDHDPFRTSPNAGSSLHNPRPKGSRLVGHIYMHEASTASSDEFHGNDSFSGKDNNNLFKKFPNLIHYVLGALGNLYGHYPSTLRNKDNTGWDDRAGTEDRVKGGREMYRSGLTKPDIYRCYKQ